MLLLSCNSHAQEPELPAGLEPTEPELPAGVEPSEPDLPSGLDTAEPGLPAGLTEDEPDLPSGMEEPEPEFPAAEGSTSTTVGDEPEDGWAERAGISGFWDNRIGLRIHEPIDQRNASLAETRLELEKDFRWSNWSGKVTLDLLYDAIPESQSIDLETGAGWLDLREAWLQKNFGKSADLKLGRQILTWGVGDLLFINDLFPKDWNSFLAGRDEQYLKAPSDALRLGAYGSALNMDLVYTPRFDSDRYIDGGRMSYYSAAAGKVVGRDSPVATDRPDDWFGDGELAVRLYRQIASFEVAAYGYDGFWKSPAGFDPATGLATFPALRVFGASIRGPAGPGIFSSEVGYYDSRDDPGGSNPLVNNSEWRGLLGYEWEVAAETTLGLQYYIETLQDYAAYVSSLPPGQPAREEWRQLVTARLTRLAMNQNLTLSLFAFWSPTDEDFYLRPNVSYKASDQWLVEGGLNLFGGTEPWTFFGQFESNSNIYVALRRSF
jgi:hypothetical protein